MGGNETYTVCRLCLSENNTFFDIFQGKGTRGWIAADIIIELLQFQVTSDDIYPHCVCSECMGKLEDFKLFKEQCETKKEFLDRAYALKHGIPLSEELIVRIFDHDGNQCEVNLGEKDVDIPVEEDPLGLDVEGNTIKTENGDSLNDFDATSSAGVIELSDELSVPMKSECFAHETTVEKDQTNVPHNSSEATMELDVKIPEVVGRCESNSEDSEFILKEEVLDIPAESDSEDNCGEPVIEEDELMVSRENDSVGVPQETEGSSYAGDNVLGAHSSGPPRDNQAGTIGFSNLPTTERIPGNEEITENHSLDIHKCKRKTESSLNSVGKTFKCSWCGKGFSSASTFRRHELNHAGHNALQCDQCNKVFHGRKSLERHLTSHSSVRPFKCDICRKSFSLKYDLNTHMGTHSQIRQFKCCECNKSFLRKRNLEIHVRVHTGERPFQCIECSKTFSRKFNLKEHMVTHSGERPFSCKECSKAFSRKSDLKVHKVTHSGERSFKCNDCNKAFSRKCDLGKHMITHSGEKPFKCN